jgi:hypothetical protein
VRLGLDFDKINTGLSSLAKPRTLLCIYFIMFKLRQYKDSDIPHSESVSKQALDFAQSAKSSWTNGKQYTKNNSIIQTYKTSLNDDYWVARCSEHSDVPFDVFKKGILENHTENESKYIHMVESYTKLECNVPNWQSFAVRYKFPTPLTDREMAIWIFAEQIDDQIVVVSLPSYVHKDKKLVKGVYCSIEVVTKLEQGVEWFMATTSDAGGILPRWVQNMSVMGAIVEDVPQFITWAKKTYV